MEEEIKELIRQQNALARTLEVTVKSMEASSKFYQEKANELIRRIEETMILIGETTILNEALKRSLSESDAQLDDLAKVTSAQMTLYQAQQQQAAAQ